MDETLSNYDAEQVAKAPPAVQLNALAAVRSGQARTASAAARALWEHPPDWKDGHDFASVVVTGALGCDSRDGRIDPQLGLPFTLRVGLPAGKGGRCTDRELGMRNLIEWLGNNSG